MLAAWKRQRRCGCDWNGGRQPASWHGALQQQGQRPQHAEQEVPARHAGKPHPPLEGEQVDCVVAGSLHHCTTVAQLAQTAADHTTKARGAPGAPPLSRAGTAAAAAVPPALPSLRRSSGAAAGVEVQVQLRAQVWAEEQGQHQGGQQHPQKQLEEGQEHSALRGAVGGRPAVGQMLGAGTWDGELHKPELQRRAGRGRQGRCMEEDGR